jgi:subtilisin family serine protease
VNLYAQEPQPATPVLAPADAFYIADGRRVALEESESARAFRLREGQAENFRAAVARSERYRIEPLSILEKYGLVLVRAADGATFADFGKVIASLVNENPIEMEVPVYPSGRIELVLVDRFMVRFREHVDEAAARALITDELNAEIVRDDEKASGRFSISFPSISPLEALGMINQLNSHPLVRDAYPQFVRIYPPRTGRLQNVRPEDFSNRELLAIVNSPQGASIPGCTPGSPPSATSTPNDPFFAHQWGLNNTFSSLQGLAGADINAVPAWQSTTGAASVRIAIIDIGVEMNHPDLASRIEMPGFDASGNGDPNPQNTKDFHGTAVAGIAAAVTGNMQGIAGVDWQAKIIPVRLGSSDLVCGSDCPWVTEDDAERRSIDAAVALGARVLVNSWTLDGAGDVYPGLEETIENALAAGSVVVFAVGNNNITQLDPDSLSVLFPASLAASSIHSLVRDGLIAVSATNPWDEFKAHVFDPDMPSSHSVEPLWGSNRGPAVTVAAPGAEVITTTLTNTGNGYAYFCGTSAAAPFVGGAASLLLSVYPNATPAEIKSWIEKGAYHPLAPSGNSDFRDDFFGYGRLDILGAFQEAAVEVMLEIQSPTDRIARKETRRVWVTVTRDSLPVAGLPVNLAVDQPNYLAIVSSLPVLTNSSGVAEVIVQGRAYLPHSTVVKASAGTTSVSAPVKVPSLAAWAQFLILTLVVVRLIFARRRMRFQGNAERD